MYDGHNGDSAAKWLVKNMYAVFETLLDEQQGALVCDLPGAQLTRIWVETSRKHLYRCRLFESHLHVGLLYIFLEPSPPAWWR